MISLINAARKSSGRPSLGWLNPLLYTSQGSFANDITKGDNKCTAEACCKQGFYAASGWDPVTGFGSIDFKKLNALMVNAVLRTGSPTASPTLRVDSSASTDPAQSTDLDPEALRVYFIVTMSVIGFTLCCVCCIVPCVDGERARTADNVTAGTTSLTPGQASAPVPAPAMRPSPNPVVNIN
eukprot:gene30192-biopygen28894